MRFHKSESAFFVLIVILLAAGATTILAYVGIRNAAGVSGAEAPAPLGHVGHYLFASLVLLATAILFGIFLIYPQMRMQVREEGELRAMARSLSRRSETLEQAALTDALTGMNNRRYFDEALGQYLMEFGRIGKPVGLMIFDLDHFKLINDTHGHDVGDDVLRAVAACLKDMTRYHDVVARLGGEEFAVVAPGMNADMLGRLAERIRAAIAVIPITLDENVRLRVTSSVGLAVWNGKEDADELFRRADQHLYRAKRLGRNRVCA